MSTIRNTILIAGAGFGMACATASPPSDLLQARNSYQRASQGPAATHNPADVHTAKLALEAAEHSFIEDGATQKTVDLAYVADRRARIAEVRSSAKQYTERQQETLADMHAAERSQVKSTSAQLGRANDQLALQGQAMKTQEQKIVDEKLRREEAEKRLAQASADLAKFASVKQEERGMVITLSGGVLFASAKSELLPAAVLKLNSVAEALVQQDPDSKMVVEGHTDSQGAAGYNQDLSQRRADAVRNHLVGRGIAADRITSQGFGLSRPVADNTSTEGRANNRRVEIVVQK
jgi:outer membrane protein OmpA-like peptidoglycan-associated protein